LLNVTVHIITLYVIIPYTSISQALSTASRLYGDPRVGCLGGKKKKLRGNGYVAHPVDCATSSAS